MAALERGVEYRRFSLADLRSILDAGVGVAGPAPTGVPLAGLPAVPVRSLSAYAVAQTR